MKKAVVFSTRVQRIIKFIDENFAAGISLEDICLATDLSESQCEKIFSREVGISVKKFLILRRLYQAAKILRSGARRSESEVRFDVGFDDLSNFIKQFKKYFGCSPLRFRNCGRSPEKCAFLNQAEFRHLSRNPRIREALDINVSMLCMLDRIGKPKK